MKTKNIHFIIFLTCAAIASTTYLLMLGSYNTLAVDDYGMVSDVEHHGILRFAYNTWLGWQGRWTTFIVSGMIFSIWGRATSLLSYTICSLLLGYACTFYTLNVLRKRMRVRAYMYITALLSIVFVNTLVMSYFDFSEFYWVCCFGYTACLYSIILLTGLILDNQRLHRWFVYPLFLLSAIYLGGHSEVMTPVVMLCIATYLVYEWHKNGFRSLFKAESCIKAIIALVVMSICFLILLIAPGNAVRLASPDIVAAAESSTGFIAHCKIVLTGLVRLFGYRYLVKIYYPLTIMGIFMYIGMKKGNRTLTNKQIIKRILWASVGLFMYVLLTIIPLVMVTACTPPTRSITHCILAIFVLFAYVGYLLGEHWHTAVKAQVWVTSITCGLCALFTCISVYSYVNEQPAVKAYYEAKQANIDYLLELKESGFQGTAYITAAQPQELHDSYYYVKHWAMKSAFLKKAVGGAKEMYGYFPLCTSGYELDPNPNYWFNKGIKAYYNLPFEVAGTEATPEGLVR